MTQFGPIWKKERRYLGKALSGAPIVKRDYSALMIKRATILLKSILDRPEDFLWEVKKLVSLTTWLSSISSDFFVLIVEWLGTLSSKSVMVL